MRDEYEEAQGRTPVARESWLVHAGRSRPARAGAGWVSGTGRRHAPSSAPALARGAAPPPRLYRPVPARGSDSRAPLQTPAPTGAPPDSSAPLHPAFPAGPAPLRDSPTLSRIPDRSAPLP